MLRKVDSKTGGEKATVLSGSVVTMKHTTYHKATDASYAMTTAFDFAGVPQEAIIKAAAEMLLIRWRTAFKNAEALDESADGQTVSVKDMLAKGRKKLSAAEKLDRTGLSRAEILALLSEDQE